MTVLAWSLDPLGSMSFGFLSSASGSPAPGLLVASVLAGGLAAYPVNHLALRAGDVPAELLIALTDADAGNAAVNLSNVTVQASLYRATTTGALYVMVRTTTLTVQSTSNGTVIFLPAVGDFADTGLHLLYLELMAGGATITSSPITIDVEPLWPV